MDLKERLTYMRDKRYATNKVNIRRQNLHFLIASKKYNKYNRGVKFTITGFSLFVVILLMGIYLFKVRIT